MSTVLDDDRRPRRIGAPLAIVRELTAQRAECERHVGRHGAKLGERCEQFRHFTEPLAQSLHFCRRLIHDCSPVDDINQTPSHLVGMSEQCNEPDW